MNGHRKIEFNMTSSCFVAVVAFSLIHGVASADVNSVLLTRCSARYFKISNQANGLATSCAAVDQVADPVMGLDLAGCQAACDTMDGGCNTVNFRWSDPNFGGTSTCYRKRCQDFQTAACTLFTQHQGRDVYTKACGTSEMYQDHLILDADGLFAGVNCPAEENIPQGLTCLDEDGPIAIESCSEQYVKISNQENGLATSCAAVDQVADPVMGLDEVGCMAACDDMIGGCNTVNFRWSDPNFGGNSTCYRKRCQDFETAACTLFTQHKGRDVYTKAPGAVEQYYNSLELDVNGLFAGIHCLSNETLSDQNDPNVCTRFISTNTSEPSCNVCSSWSLAASTPDNVRTCLVWERSSEDGLTTCAEFAESALELQQKEAYNQYLRERWKSVGLCNLTYFQGSTCQIQQTDGSSCLVRDQPCHGGTELGGVAGVLSAGWQMTFGTQQDNHVCTMCGRGTYGSCEDACSYRRNFFWSGYNLGSNEIGANALELAQLYDAFVELQPNETYDEPQTLELSEDVLTRLPPSNPLSALQLTTSAVFSLISVADVFVTVRDQIKYISVGLASHNNTLRVPIVLSTSGVKVYETCSCHQCPRGYFQDGLGETFCKSCDDILPGSDTRDRGAHGPELCKCLEENDVFLSSDNSTCIPCDHVRDGITAGPSAVCNCRHDTYEGFPPEEMDAPPGWITCLACPDQSSTFNVDKNEHDYGYSLENCYCRPGTYGLTDCPTCPPCREAFEVDIFPSQDILNSTGCEKMAVCGATQQTKALQFLVVDNKKRDNLELTVQMHDGSTTRVIRAVAKHSASDNASYEYSFNLSSTNVGAVIFEVFANGKQIPESPLRLQVAPRDCAMDTGDSFRQPDVDGNCICADGAVEIGDVCVELKVLLPSILVPLFLLSGVAAILYLRHKQRQADSIWEVKAYELKFDDPPEILGRGTFGLVLLAEYRGTQVAVKRVIPPRGRSSQRGGKATRLSSGSIGSGKQDSFRDLSQVRDEEHPAYTRSHDSLMDLNEAPNFLGSTDSVLRRSTYKISGRTFSLFCRDYYSLLKADFVVEMRQLSKLRHPCITTVMGAVIERGAEPMLVMEYMDHGSLYDILHNTTFLFEGELILSILRDIAQGLRFLHSANPKVIHGDLKSQNVLVDSRFRAKVADFGLSQKKCIGACGTPLWMAPELLRNESTNTAASDVYSFGIMLYEVYSRKEPYEGQDLRTVLKLVCDPIVNLRPPVPDACPPVVSELMRECLESRPDARPAAAELDARLKQLDVDNVKPGQMIFSKQKKKEEHKTTDLLLDVFPPHIAEALREGRKIEPETRECVTILFSDIVGFTSIAASLSPLKVSDMLDRLYLQFDELTRKHDLFKVETIGDAYMCAGNLVKDQQDHAKRIAEFAADAIMIASETEIDVDNPRRGYIKLRIGFHSGPVVTNVVGSCNLRFSLFGDTVNTASRMESTSEPGRIHCSERAAKLLHKQAPEIPVKLRGTIDIKGKGEMVTYWVNEVHQGSDTDFLLDTEFVVSPMAGELVKLDVERDVSFVSHSNRRSPCTRKTGRGSIAEESERPESKQSFEDLEALENGDSGFLNRADKN